MTYDKSFFKIFDLSHKWQFYNMLQEHAYDQGFEYVSEAIYYFYVTEQLSTKAVGQKIGMGHGGVQRILAKMKVPARSNKYPMIATYGKYNFGGRFHIKTIHQQRRIWFTCGKIDTERNLYSWIRCSRCYMQVVADEELTYTQVIKTLNNHICRKNENATFKN